MLIFIYFGVLGESNYMRYIWGFQVDMQQCKTLLKDINLSDIIQSMNEYISDMNKCNQHSSDIS